LLTAAPPHPSVRLGAQYRISRLDSRRITENQTNNPCGEKAWLRVFSSATRANQSGRNPATRDSDGSLADDRDPDGRLADDRDPDGSLADDRDSDRRLADDRDPNATRPNV
jgi:hypothetical protein